MLLDSVTFGEKQRPGCIHRGQRRLGFRVHREHLDHSALVDVGFEDQRGRRPFRYLMRYLSFETRRRFLGWMAFGLVIYFLYGVRHSCLRQARS